MSDDTVIKVGQVMGVNYIRPCFMIGSSMATTNVRTTKGSVLMIVILGACDTDKQNEFDLMKVMADLGWVQAKRRKGE